MPNEMVHYSANLAYYKVKSMSKQAVFAHLSIGMSQSVSIGYHRATTIYTTVRLQVPSLMQVLDTQPSVKYRTGT